MNDKINLYSAGAQALKPKSHHHNFGWQTDMNVEIFNIHHNSYWVIVGVLVIREFQGNSRGRATIVLKYSIYVFVLHSYYVRTGSCWCVLVFPPICGGCCQTFCQFYGVIIAIVVSSCGFAKCIGNPL